MRRAAVGLAAAVVAVTGLTVTASPAAADDVPCVNGCVPGGGGGGGDGAGGSSGGGRISVVVYGSGVRSGGEEFSVPRTSVRTHPVCWYDYALTGKEYWTNWQDGTYENLNNRLPYEDRFEPWPGMSKWKDDEEGGWWTPRCSSQHWPGDLDGFFEHTRAYFDEHGPVYVEAGDVPPAAEVPPEVLAEIAFEAMDIPVGEVAWNPSRTGDGATFVGMDTWVWVEGAATSVSVTAEVSTGTWARVDAALDTLVVEAPGASTVTCADAGIPWTEGASASDACRLVFDRSSANQPTKAGFTVPTSTTTATATWTASWVSSLSSTPTELPSQEVVTTGEVPVAEIQSLVTR